MLRRYSSGGIGMTSRLLSELSTMPHGIIGISASGKMGKSALAFSIAELVPGLRDRPHYLFETAQADLSCFPGFTLVTDLDDVPSGSLVIIEDLGRIFGARGSAQNQQLPRWLHDPVALGCGHLAVPVSELHRAP